jgi:hypothetical protein
MICYIVTISEEVLNGILGHRTHLCVSECDSELTAGRSSGCIFAGNHLGGILSRGDGKHERLVHILVLEGGRLLLFYIREIEREREEYDIDRGQ